MLPLEEEEKQLVMTSDEGPILPCFSSAHSLLDEENIRAADRVELRNAVVASFLDVGFINSLSIESYFVSKDEDAK